MAALPRQSSRSQRNSRWGPNTYERASPSCRGPAVGGVRTARQHQPGVGRAWRRRQPWAWRRCSGSTGGQRQGRPRLLVPAAAYRSCLRPRRCGGPLASVARRRAAGRGDASVGVSGVGVFVRSRAGGHGADLIVGAGVVTRGPTLGVDVCEAMVQAEWAQVWASSQACLRH